MTKITEQTWEKMVKIYLKCDKQELAEMLATRDEIANNRKDNYSNFNMSKSSSLTFEDNNPGRYPPESGGFTDHNGRSVRCGDQVRYQINGRVGILEEALQDGDAYVTFKDGSPGNVKWNNLEKI